MAIQVNGTTVINDSRALTNISSVDSSVVSAMSSAGVGGGATSLITNWTNVPNAKNWSLTLSASYDIIRIYFNLVGVDNQATNVDLRLRLQYSGGTETGYDYMFLRDSGSSGGVDTQDYLPFATSSGTSTTYPTRATGMIEFAWHGDSSRATHFHTSFLDTFNYNGNINYANNRDGIVYSHTATRAHTAAYFYTDYASTVNYTTGQYLMMGVTL